MGHEYVAKVMGEDGLISYSKEENETWETLFNRQEKLIQGRAYQGFLDGLDLLDFPRNRIPQAKEVNKVLNAKTGWSVEPVAAIIPATEFFTLLSKKKFPAASFIRIPEELDYIEEPDIFHELYGHCPLITDQRYADFLQGVGEIGLTINPKRRKYLFRLFWFTIEFGLIQTNQGLVSYGGGILSSIYETVSALEDPKAQRIPFDLMTALRNDYRIDIPQTLYFIIESLDQVYSTLNENLEERIEEAFELGDLPVAYPPKEGDGEKKRMIDC